MLSNWKIGTRLGLGFGILLLLMLAVGLYGIRSVQGLHVEIDLLIKDRMVKVEQANAMIDNLNVIARALRNLVIDDNKDHQADETRRIIEARKIIGDLLESLSQTITSESGVAMIRQIKELRQTYTRHTDAYMELIKSEQTLKAKMLLLSDIREVQRNYLKSLEDLINFQTEMANKAGNAAADDAKAAMRLITILLITAVALSVVLAVLIVRSITRPVGMASALADTMAKGDFTSKLELNQKDEVGQMATSLNLMVGQLGHDQADHRRRQPPHRLVQRPGCGFPAALVQCQGDLGQGRHRGRGHRGDEHQHPIGLRCHGAVDQQRQHGGLLDRGDDRHGR